MDNKSRIISEDLDKFKHKLSQNWFGNLNNSIENNIEQKNQAILNRNKTKLIANIRRDYDRKFIEDMIEQGIKSYKINGKYFNYKEYQKIYQEIHNAHSRLEEVPSIIFDFKGPYTLVTRIENIFHKKSFIKKQIVKILFDDARKKYEKDNRIYIDKRISNIVNIGDIIEISDSNIILKVISLEENKINLTNKYNKLLNIVEERHHSKFNKIDINKRKFSLISENLIPKTPKSLEYESYNIIDIDRYVQRDPCIRINTQNKHVGVSTRKIFFHEEVYVHPKSCPILLLAENESNDKAFMKNINDVIRGPKININDEKDEYKIIYQDEEENLFAGDKIDFDLNFSAQKDEEIVQSNVINEDADDFELDDFWNKYEVDEEEMQLEGKYFDNLYEEKIKSKREKMDLLFHNIIHRQKAHFKTNSKDKFNNSFDAGMNTNNNLNTCISVSDYDMPEMKQLQYFEKKERIKSSTSLEQISSRNKAIVCEVLEEGEVNINSSLSIRNKDINSGKDISIISAKDIIDINKCISLGINIFSFIINSNDNIKEIKEILGEDQLKNLKIFACLETQESLINFDSILSEVDGVIINHGFKYYNFKYKDLYLIEAYIIEKCKEFNKPLILKTNSIKSVNLYKPAIFKLSILDFAVKSGIDAIIINDDSCEIQDFTNTIKACRNVILEIERTEDNIYRFHDQSRHLSLHKISNMSIKEKIILSILENAVKLSHEISAELIILFTDEINFAKLLSNLRPSCIIACPTTSPILNRFLRLFRGVIPFHCKNCYKKKDILNKLKERFLEKHIIENFKAVLVNAYLEKNGTHVDENMSENGMFILQEDNLK